MTTIAKTDLIRATEDFVRSRLEGEGTGHDWDHIVRVRNLAVRLAQAEGGCDLTVVELAALLHDIADWKFHGGDDSAGPRVSREWLASQGVEEAVIAHVCDIIAHLSFKGAGVETRMATKEGMLVQDADRLEALGAIGIARAFAYGGAKGRQFYDPAVKPVMHASFEAYKKNAAPTVNHFYEKLFLLADRMNTETARRLARKRHRFMEEFLERFYAEWNGVD